MAVFIGLGQSSGIAFKYGSLGNISIISEFECLLIVDAILKLISTVIANTKTHR